MNPAAIRTVLAASLLVLAVAMATHGLIDQQYRGDPLRQSLISDSLSYDRQARDWATNGLSTAEVFHQSPLYPLLLAQVRKVDSSPGTPDRMLWLQYALTSLALALLVPLGRLWFGSTRAGLFAAGTGLLHGPFVYHSLKLLPIALALATQAAALLFVTLARKRSSLLYPAAAGIAGGIAAVARAEFLLFLIAAAIMLYFDRRKLPAPVVFLLCTLVVVAPVTVHNALQGDPVLIASAGGENLFIGNQRGGDGGHTALNPQAGDLFSQKIVAKSIAEKSEGRSLRPSEISAYWKNRAIREVLADPTGWVYLEFRKLARVFDPGDPSDMYSLPLERELYLAGLYLLFLPAGFLGACGLFGMWCGLKERRNEILPVVLFVGIHLAVLLIFFVSTRLRLPFYLGLAALSGYGLDRIATWWQEKSDRNKALAVTLAIVLASAIGIMQTRPSSQDRVRLAAVFSASGDIPAGLAVLKPELEKPTPDPIALDQAGWMHHKTGAFPIAEKLYRQALGTGAPEMKLSGNHLQGIRAVQTRSRLAGVLESQHRFQEALQEHDRAVASRWAVAGTWYERGMFKSRRGDRNGARQDLAQANLLSGGAPRKD